MIPDELRVALAKDYVRENFQTGEPWSMTIARAILAERQRCADLTEKYRDESMGGEVRLAASYIRREILDGRSA